MNQQPCCHRHSETSAPLNHVNADSVYTCPMHPEVEQNQTGFCPICGMSLELKTRSLEAKDDDSEYCSMRGNFLIGLALTVPVVILSLFHNSFSYWGQWILSSIVVFWVGGLFFKRAWYSVVNRSLNMFTLVALGVGAAYFYSAAMILGTPEGTEPLVYFEAACVITILVLLGQIFEVKAKNKTGQAIKLLLGHSAKTAHLLLNGREKECPIDQVVVGDILRVKPGEKTPVDGVVTEGASFIDESMITGESIPVQKGEGDPVIGGTINQAGSFLMRAQHVGSETILARIVKLVSEAQRSKAPVQRLADMIAGYFVPVVLLISLVTFCIWSYFGPEPQLAFALVNAIAVLIIACPCALGLATPMSIMVGIGRGAEMGVLIKNAEALEMLEKVNTIVLDKTGTLTEGKPKVMQIAAALPEWIEKDVVRLSATVEQYSEHPLACAIVQNSIANGIELRGVTDFSSITGGGVTGIVDSVKITVGKEQLMEMNGFAISPDLKTQARQAQEKAQTVVWVAADATVIGFIAIADPVKQSSRQAVKELHSLGLKVIMLTGDGEHTGKAVAVDLGIDRVYANVNPMEKNNVIIGLKRQGNIVAMAGDGINDAPALASADVGIAMGTGTDIAMESAGVTLVKGDLKGIVRAIALSRATMRNIRQNLFFAFIYNIAGIPIAAGIFYPFTGLLLNPMIASAAMSLSSVSVIFNALRLKR